MSLAQLLRLLVCERLRDRLDTSSAALAAGLPDPEVVWPQGTSGSPSFHVAWQVPAMRCDLVRLPESALKSGQISPEEVLPAQVERGGPVIALLLRSQILKHLWRWVVRPKQRPSQAFGSDSVQAALAHHVDHRVVFVNLVRVAVKHPRGILIRRDGTF